MLSSELVRRLVYSLNHSKAELAVAHDGQRLQPVYALIPVSLVDSLDNFLSSGQRARLIDSMHSITYHRPISAIHLTPLSISTPSKIIDVLNKKDYMHDQ